MTNQGQERIEYQHFEAQYCLPCIIPARVQHQLQQARQFLLVSNFVQALARYRELSQLCSGDAAIWFEYGNVAATNVDLVRIEWPSGIVQTMTNVAAKQFLTVVEHQEPGASPLHFTSVSRSTNGAVDLSVGGDAGLRYRFDASSNLVNWSWLGVRTNLTGSVQFTDTTATNFSRRFYRVSVP